ncbi:MAG: hypothetical protein ABW185_11685, partial [Sedimenticola sp.]
LYRLPWKEFPLWVASTSTCPEKRTHLDSVEQEIRTMTENLFGETFRQIMQSASFAPVAAIF